MTSTAIDQTLQAFVEEHPFGWSHEDWLQLLGSLEAAGADVSDPEALGYTLERTRLGLVLHENKVKGLGPKRIEAIVERFGTLWNASHATAADFAEIPTIPKGLAEKLETTL